MSDETDFREALGDYDDDLAEAMMGLSAFLPMSGSGEIGERVPNYRLIDHIGDGGMGEVWKAEQLEPFRRQVALKLVKPGMDTKAVLGRFQAEQRVLGIMEHPHIARILDGGKTDRGRPYFAMELVEGVPLTTYADDEELSFEDRLRLMIPVCEAVEHAHRKLIVHRDLKPSNILVSEVDGKPYVKIIDFGIAKAMQGSSAYQTMVTSEGVVRGTLGYMSPEQTAMDDDFVDTRTDVYGLGVILYELLTGRLPFDSDALGKLSHDEALETIREKTPKKPTQARRRDFSEGHSGDFGPIGREIDLVVMKALAREPDRRYQSAADLGREIQRLIDRRPVEARPPSIGYVATKWISRNRFGIVAGCVAIALALATWAVTEHRSRLALAQSAEDAWIDKLLGLAIDDAPSHIYARDELPRSTLERLKVVADDGSIASRTEFVATNALLAHGESERLASKTWEKVLTDSSTPRSERLHAAAALALHAPDDPRWETMAEDVASWLTGQPVVQPWFEYFQPIANQLRPSLSDKLFHRESPETRRNAAILLSEYFGGDLEAMVSLTMIARPGQMAPLVEALRGHGEAAIDRLDEVLAREFRQAETEEGKDVLAEEQSRIGMALMLLGQADLVAPYLVHPSPNLDPRLRTFLIHGMADYQVDSSVIAEFLGASEAWLVRAGLIALGDYSLTSRQIEGLKPAVTSLYIEHGDPGVHGAAEWLLRHWHRQVDTSEDASPEYPELPRQLEPEPNDRWYVTPSGMTMTVIQGPVEFTMGVPEDEPGRQLHTERRAKEIPHRREIPRSFAIATKELTFEEYERFQPGFFDLARTSDRITTEKNREHITPKTTLDGVKFRDVLRYCNWLSEEEGIPEDQHCFVIPENPKGAVVFKENFLSLKGYRLASEAEWEFASRAHAITARHFGLSEEMLTKYGWYLKNSDNHARSPGILRPNGLGLFDMLGNRYEWVHGYHVEYPDTAESIVVDDESAVGLVPLPGQTNPHHSKRGGSSDGASASLTSGSRSYGNYTAKGITIRIARTLY